MRTLATILTAFTLTPGFGVTSVGPNGGQILSGVIAGGPRTALVYLPPGYDTSPGRYPVIYLLHGLPGSPSEYVSGTDLLHFADAEINSGAMRPFIAVMPSAGVSHDYRGEWAGAWERYVVDHVVPWSDSHFRTLASPAGRTIAGLSAGGYGAVDIALRNPTLFRTVESWSGYFHPLPDAPFTHASTATLRANDPQLLAAGHARNISRLGMRFFLSTGPTHDHRIPASETIAFARQLERLGVSATLDTVPTQRGQWRQQVQHGLQWAFERRPTG